MISAIRTITMPFMLNVTVNCYLVRAGDGFILIDTGRFSKRRFVEDELEQAGCQPGKLRLIILTHGDFDHCGNAAYLRTKFGSRIAMHPDDSGMVEHGDMFWNRKPPNRFFRILTGRLFRLHEADQFTPDIWLRENDTLSEYGLDARVIELPGHSKGSIGILAASGDLFCGDLLANTDKPALWSMMDDAAAAGASLEKLKTLPVDTIYPGHGRPFPVETFPDWPVR